MAKVQNALFFIYMLLFPAMTIELLSGSTPPTQYFNPLVIFFFAICYGLPFILIREIKIKWNLTWQFMFLVPIIGIYIEGIFMQSFFNTGHEDLGILSNYGVFFGVQWPWALYLIIMHGIFSLIVPLFITDILFPNFRTKRFLNKITIIVSLALISLLTLFQLAVIKTGEQAMYSDYIINIGGTVVCLLVIGLLVLLSFVTRKITFKTSSFTVKRRDHFIGFLYLFMVLIASQFFPHINMYLVIISLIVLILIALVFSFKYIYLSERTLEDLLPLFNGTIFFLSLFAIFQEFGIIPNLDPPQGMAIVGLSFILLTVLMNLIAKYRMKAFKDS